jgi:hypothetical protein
MVGLDDEGNASARLSNPTAHGLFFQNKRCKDFLVHAFAAIVGGDHRRGPLVLLLSAISGDVFFGSECIS